MNAIAVVQLLQTLRATSQSALIEPLANKLADELSSKAALLSALLMRIDAVVQAFAQHKVRDSCSFPRF